MLNQFKNHITTSLNFLKEAKLLVAISGGVDSVVLTHLCHGIGLNIALAHCNFNLRGNESDADEDFVRRLAEQFNLEVFVQRFNTDEYAKTNKRSTQMAARELRYNWFEELSNKLGYEYILTAHHADDNLETFLINFTRGTGIEGLTGIPEVNGRFVRPLLSFSSEKILTHAKQEGIKWREDSSNKSVKYLRNKLRHEVVPILKDINPELLQSFQSTMSHLNDSASIINDQMDTFLKQAMVYEKDSEIRFKISVFKKLKHPKAYLFEALKAYGFTAWNDILRLLDAQPGKQVLSNTHRLIKDREYLLLSPKLPELKGPITILEQSPEVNTPFGLLRFEVVNEVNNDLKHTIYVDKHSLKYPLKLRKRKTGDVFYPYGMLGKKKLSKYFKDEKLSLLDKEQTWLLCNADDEIIWVVGKRADNRFRVTNATQEVLKITLN
ncbi:tRNA lysidine(34) synthetase TilS [Cognatitamlana onchidii]|uniref:tRNA lysidine(34) synthetase TilS n=1 Tax=Cognatitamlana onchidii TaxID=2562860 RepID=UPI0010A659FB|nr:tRNA lysidine(34) synthetase TilS [Algibacter onchidii]